MLLKFFILDDIRLEYDIFNDQIFSITRVICSLYISVKSNFPENSAERLTDEFSTPEIFIKS